MQEQIDELRTLAISSFARLRELLANPNAIHEARALLAEQVGKFALNRVEENGSMGLKATGTMDFFGDKAFTQPGGAGPESLVKAHNPISGRIGGVTLLNLV